MSRCISAHGEYSEHELSDEADPYFCTRCFTTDEDAIMAALQSAEAERDRLRAEALEFSSALGFGDNVTERAATLAEMVDPITEAFDAARNHNECAVTCELCGEVLARTICEHCHGSGCGPGTALGAYSECEWCAGAGKVHDGCVEMSYADLAAERDRLATKVARVEELADRWERRCSGGPHRLCTAGQLRAALAEEPPDA